MFGGILIDTKTLPESANEFDERLKGALATWKAAGKKGEHQNPARPFA